tara:strand:- start:6425 stop:8029 length:1605 start_codon:yes stop_codon:yes gene_type:complete
MTRVVKVLKRAMTPLALQHKRTYDTKYEQSPKRIKYREELNRERRKRGIYGHGGPDVSHTTQNTLVLENPHSNRARHFAGHTLKPVKKMSDEELWQQWGVGKQPKDVTGGFREEEEPIDSAWDELESQLRGKTKHITDPQSRRKIRSMGQRERAQNPLSTKPPSGWTREMLSPFPHYGKTRYGRRKKPPMPKEEQHRRQQMLDPNKVGQGEMHPGSLRHMIDMEDEHSADDPNIKGTGATNLMNALSDKLDYNYDDDAIMEAFFNHMMADKDLPEGDLPTKWHEELLGGDKKDDRRKFLEGQDAQSRGMRRITPTDDRSLESALNENIMENRSRGRTVRPGKMNIQDLNSYLSDDDDSDDDVGRIIKPSIGEDEWTELFNNLLNPDTVEHLQNELGIEDDEELHALFDSEMRGRSVIPEATNTFVAPSQRGFHDANLRDAWPYDDLTTLPSAPSFHGTPFNEKTGFTMSEDSPIDNAWGIIKLQQQGGGDGDGGSTYSGYGGSRAPKCPKCGALMQRIDSKWVCPCGYVLPGFM